LNSDLNNFPKNKLSIITFNYDRSIENYLLNKFMFNYKLSEQEAIENVKSIPIIHPYGSLGQLHMLADKNEFARHYNTAANDKVIRACMDSIKIIYEDLDIDKYFKKAYKLLEQAKIVIFLGFGYHKENLERLKLREILTNGKTIFGTTKGFEFGEIQKLRNDLGSGGAVIRISETEGLDINTYLRKYSHYFF